VDCLAGAVRRAQDPQASGVARLSGTASANIREASAADKLRVTDMSLLFLGFLLAFVGTYSVIGVLLLFRFLRSVASGSN
jgi:hypothetical protein